MDSTLFATYMRIGGLLAAFAMALVEERRNIVKEPLTGLLYAALRGFLYAFGAAIVLKVLPLPFQPILIATVANWCYQDLRKRR